MKIITFQVTIKVPSDVSFNDAREYVRESVQTWKGQLSPEDPLFELEVKSVR